MTFAPQTIKEVRAYLKGQDPDLDDLELGIVGGPGHVATGTSYHLGADQLKMWKNPYSVRTARDKAGLSDASSALDADDDLDELREMSVWIVEECRKGAPDTLDLREIIYSPDGVQVLQWDRERGVASLPQPHPDLSHRGHTHFSWYRDSEFRDKTAIFKRFYAEREGTDVLEVPIPFGEGDGVGAAPSKRVEMFQHAINRALAATGSTLAPLNPDGRYGGKTQAAYVAVVGAPAGDGTLYDASQRDILYSIAYAGKAGPAGPPGQDGKTPTVVRLTAPVDLPVVAAE